MAEAIINLDDDGDNAEQRIEGGGKETDEPIITLDDGATNAPTKAQVAEMIDCPICLQICVHPCKLPCRHIFCFLCVKGLKNRLCAMCRQEFPIEFLDRPELVTTNAAQEASCSSTEDSEYQWFYRGRNGWWQYDPRTCQEIEDAYKSGEKHCTILVAGYVYIVDFEQMLQQRQNDPSRKRQVKRDYATVPKKGVAGLRIANASNMPATMSVDDGQQQQPSTSSTAASSALPLCIVSSSSPPATSAPSLLSTTAGQHLIATIAATDAVRIASDIIDSTLVHSGSPSGYNRVADAGRNTDAQRDIFNQLEETLNFNVATADDVASDVELTLDDFRALTLADTGADYIPSDSDSSDEEATAHKKPTINSIL